MVKAWGQLFAKASFQKLMWHWHLSQGTSEDSNAQKVACTHDCRLPHSLPGHLNEESIAPSGSWLLPVLQSCKGGIRCNKISFRWYLQLVPEVWLRQSLGSLQGMSSYSRLQSFGWWRIPQVFVLGTSKPELSGFQWLSGHLRQWLNLASKVLLVTHEHLQDHPPRTNTKNVCWQRKISANNVRTRNTCSAKHICLLAQLTEIRAQGITRLRFRYIFIYIDSCGSLLRSTLWCLSFWLWHCSTWSAFLQVLKDSFPVFVSNCQVPESCDPCWEWVLNLSIPNLWMTCNHQALPNTSKHETVRRGALWDPEVSCILRKVQWETHHSIPLYNSARKIRSVCTILCRNQSK